MGLAESTGQHEWTRPATWRPAIGTSRVLARPVPLTARPRLGPGSRSTPPSLAEGGLKRRPLSTPCAPRRVLLADPGPLHQCRRLPIPTPVRPHCRFRQSPSSPSKTPVMSSPQTPLEHPCRLHQSPNSVKFTCHLQIPRVPVKRPCLCQSPSRRQTPKSPSLSPSSRLIPRLSSPVLEPLSNSPGISASTQTSPSKPPVH